MPYVRPEVIVMLQQTCGSFAVVMRQRPRRKRDALRTACYQYRDRMLPLVLRSMHLDQVTRRRQRKRRFGLQTNSSTAVASAG